MTIDTDKLKALALAATQGNWTVDKRSADCAYLNGPPRSYDECYFENAADAEFIAACREMVPELIAEVERLRAEITVLGKAPEINVENAETRMDTGFGGAGQIAAPAAGTENDALAALNNLAEEAHANGNDWDGYIVPLVNRVRAAIEAGTEKDTARLDFMIAEECQIEHMDRPGAVPLYRVRWPWGDISQRDWSASGREAIDAAVAVEEPPCSS